MKNIQFDKSSSFAKVTRSEAQKVAYMDAPFVSTKPGRYARDNADIYYTAINTWLLLVEANNKRVAWRLQNYILEYGLLQAIEHSCSVADQVLAGNKDIDSRIWKEFLASEPWYIGWAPKQLLALTRFLKRFSPTGADKLREDSIQGFIDTQVRLKSLWGDNHNDRTRYRYSQPNNYGRKYGDRIQKNVEHYILDDIKGTVDRILCRFPDLTQEDVDLWSHFSSGSTRDSGKDVLLKFAELVRENHNLDSPLYPLVKGKGRERKHSICRVQAVPKSYKKARIIAMCDTIPSYHLQGVHHFMMDAINEGPYNHLLKLSDQSPNRILCYEGSAYQVYATRDFSSASDSISSMLAYYVLPRRFTKWTEKYNPVLYELPDGTLDYLGTYLVSGTPVTFDSESPLFLAIAIVSTNYTQLFYAEPLEEPHSYGDDVIIDYRAVGMFDDICADLGFIVNKDKSYSIESPYRESCGVEYWDGQIAQGPMWPRNEFKPGKACQVDNVVSLITLQHKLYNECWEASQFLAQCICAIAPGMTFSSPCQELDDLWDDVKHPTKEVLPPYGTVEKRVDYGFPMMELHWSTRTKYLGRKTQKLQSGTYLHGRHLDRIQIQTVEAGAFDCDVEMYKYVQFLKHGPRYASWLDMVLHVSEPANWDSLIGIPQTAPTTTRAYPVSR